MMKAVYKTEGAQLSIVILSTPQVREFIESHSSVLNSSFEKVEMSDAMRSRLQRSDWIFSGMKTFHELNEAFPSLIDENGDRKSFERFLNDVRSIDQTYNSNYLRAEYNFVNASAEMAAKWEGFMQDGDRYNLQYRTQKDDKVRPEHAALDGVTLPPSDSFWAEFYPPNGWNCRCTVVQVRKSKYPATPHDEAMRLGDEALQRDSKGIFRFNPGIEQSTVPAYNPYTIRRCRDCDIAKGTDTLARFIPKNQACEACKIVHKMLEAYQVIPTKNGCVRVHEKHGKREKAENVSIASYFAEKYGHEVDLLPNPSNKKSADVFNRTLGIEQEYKVNSKPTESAIDNELRKAAKQADNIVLRIDSKITLEDLRNGIRGRVTRCVNVKSVTIIRHNKDASYTREQILGEYFKIRQEDFK
ncbi:MAG: minor capsid protein [Muribaculaceae bacterium]|nr:minor capsid protein [Muribaculaceae bacterium]